MESSPSSSSSEPAASPPRTRCLNLGSRINGRFDTKVEVRVNRLRKEKKKAKFIVNAQGAIIQASSQSRGSNPTELGDEYVSQIGRKLRRYEVNDTCAFHLLVTTHGNSFWVVAAPEAVTRHSGICRLLGDKRHPPATHVLQVGDFLRLGSIGFVVIETHNGVENRVLSEEKIQKIMKDATTGSDEENSDDESLEEGIEEKSFESRNGEEKSPVCHICFDEECSENGLRKCQTTEADNQVCLSSVDATCSVCKTTFRSSFNFKEGRHVKRFKVSLEPPYVSLLIATKQKVAQRLYKARFQLSCSTILTRDGKKSSRPIILGRSYRSDMVLDHMSISARHASIRFKNGDFYFLDECSSNGSYLNLRRPVELHPYIPVQFRLRKSILSLKAVDKWNRRFKVGRCTKSARDCEGESSANDNHSIGSDDDDIRISDESGTRNLPRRTRASILQSLPPKGQLNQDSREHLDLLYALAYPDREKERTAKVQRQENIIEEFEGEDSKLDQKIEELEDDDSNDQFELLSKDVGLTHS